MNEEESDSSSGDLDGPVFDAGRVHEISANAKAFSMKVFHSKAEMMQDDNNNASGLPPVPTVDELMKQYNLPSFARLANPSNRQVEEVPDQPFKRDLTKGPDERREAFKKRLEEKAAVLMEELKVDKQTAQALLARSDCSLEDSKELFYDVRYDNLQDDRAALMNTLVQMNGRLERVRLDPEVHTLEKFCDDMRNKAKDRVAALDRLLKLLRMHLLIDNTGARSTNETLSATVTHANSLRRQRKVASVPAEEPARFKPEEIFELVEGGTYDTSAKSVSGAKQQATSEMRRGIAQQSFERDAERIVAKAKAQRGDTRRRRRK